jgi:hypothetical protein
MIVGPHLSASYRYARRTASARRASWAGPVISAWAESAPPPAFSSFFYFSFSFSFLFANFGFLIFFDLNDFKSPKFVK